MVVVLASSLEVATPTVFADMVERLRTQLPEPRAVQISAHTHNDGGCAVAAAGLSLLAGAEIVEGCLFGNGERAGNADLITLALGLYTRVSGLLVEREGEAVRLKAAGEGRGRGNAGGMPYPRHWPGCQLLRHLCTRGWEVR